MMIESAKSLGLSHWQAELTCGHIVILHTDLDSPSTTIEISCPQCEGIEEEE